MGSNHLEPEVAGKRVEVALRHGAGPPIADRIDDLDGERFDLGEVVASRPHLGAEPGVDRPCLIPGEGGGPVPSPQLVVEARDVLEGDVGEFG